MNRLDQVDDIHHRNTGLPVAALMASAYGGKFVHSSTMAPISGCERHELLGPVDNDGLDPFLVFRRQVAALLSPEDSPEVRVLKQR